MKYPLKERRPEDLARVFDVGRQDGGDDAQEHYKKQMVYTLAQVRDLGKAEGWLLLSQHLADEEPFTDDQKEFVAHYQAGYVWQYREQLKLCQKGGTIL